MNSSSHIPHISKFSGKSGEKLSTWLCLYENALEIGGIHSDADKIKRLMFYLADDALDWFVDQKNNGKLSSLFSEVCAKMKAKFASEKILVAKMQDGDVKSYIKRFEAFMEEFVVKEDEIKLKYFIRGLDNYYYDRVSGQALHSYESAKDRVLDIHERLEDDRPGQLSVFRASTQWKKTEAMDKPRSPLTENEREIMYREGRCFYCREQGHVLRECLKRPPLRSREGSSWNNQNALQNQGKVSSRQ